VAAELMMKRPVVMRRLLNTSAIPRRELQIENYAERWLTQLRIEQTSVCIVFKPSVE
jgi:hypothetical protein